MNYLFNFPILPTDDMNNYDRTLLSSLPNFSQPADLVLSFQQQMLMQLIKQHRHQAGWIVLLAPSPRLIKQLAIVEQLPLHKVLVIHKKQLSNLNAVIHTALTSGKCKVIINCSQAVPESDDNKYQQLAAEQLVWFYQLEHLCQRLQPH